MKINSLVKERTQSLGLVNEIDNLVDLMFNSVNLVHDDKNIMVDAVLENGERHRMYCSKAVSKGLREKTITKAMLYGFPIFEAKTKTGEDILRIELPTGKSSNWFAINVKDLKAEDFVPTTVASYEELLA